MVALLLSREASAATFGSDGSFAFDALSVATVSFETELDGEGMPLGADDVGALEGGKVLAVQPFAGADVPLTLPAQAATYRASVWARGTEATALLEVSYDAELSLPKDVLVLYPTGRMTSDGWVELANAGLRVDGAHVARATLGLFAPNEGAFDAFELVAMPGAPPVPSVAQSQCGGVTDTISCDADQVCLWNLCRDSSGWVPPIPAQRDEVAAYLEQRARVLFGPFREREVDLPHALDAFAQMSGAATPWAYWNAFALGIRRLHDGHTTTGNLTDFVFDNPRRLTLCFLEGEADLTHGTAPADAQYLDVLVSHVGDSERAFGLRAGDRLVSVDHLHPIEWARGLVSTHWSLPPVSNRETFAELASALRGLISRYAREIEVIRCDEATLTCGEVESIRIDQVPFEDPDSPVESVQCDSRPLRHLASSPVDHGGGTYSGLVTDADPAEAIYGLEWESLYTTGGDGVAPAINQAVSLWKQQAKGVILDHRTGNGGTSLGAQLLWKFAVPKHPSNFYQDRQRAEDEQPSLEEGAEVFQLSVSQGEVEYAGSPNPVEGVPVALLLTKDVSASDWLPLGMKGQPNHRIFGPFQTNGAFSTRYSFGYWLGMTYVIATGDTYVPSGATHNGFGVEPDEVVLPLQSDLVSGTDTVFEAALAWVRQESQP